MNKPLISSQNKHYILKISFKIIFDLSLFPSQESVKNELIFKTFILLFNFINYNKLHSNIINDSLVHFKC